MCRLVRFISALAVFLGAVASIEASAQGVQPTIGVYQAEQRFVPNEVVIEVEGAPTQDAVDALARRHRLVRLKSQYFQLTNSTLFRWRIPDGRSVEDVVRVLSADANIKSAQPNYFYSVQQRSEAE